MAGIFRSNQEVAVTRARNAVAAAEAGLRAARDTLNRTPRASNGAATDAVRSWERALSSAKSDLSRVEADLARSRR